MNEQFELAYSSLITIVYRYDRYNNYNLIEEKHFRKYESAEKYASDYMYSDAETVVIERKPLYD